MHLPIYVIIWPPHGAGGDRSHQEQKERQLKNNIIIIYLTHLQHKFRYLRQLFRSCCLCLLLLDLFPRMSLCEEWRVAFNGQLLKYNAVTLREFEFAVTLRFVEFDRYNFIYCPSNFYSS